MKSIIIIHLCVLFLTIVLNGIEGNTLREIRDEVDKVANENENKIEKGNINGVFEPYKNGLLGHGINSISFKGLLIRGPPEPMNVTMKFITESKGSNNELRIYLYLRALRNTDVEVFGVPSVQYYGTWGNISMMAMTLFEPGYQETFRAKNLTQTDLLIICREFARITKWTHLQNVYHRHFHLRHFMFFGKLCYIYDFTVATIIENSKENARHDWRLFIAAMHTYIKKVNPNLSWLGFSEWMDLHPLICSLRNDIDSNEQFIGLRRVFVEFAKNVFSYSRTPTNQSFYDGPFQIISEEIERCATQPGEQVVPSWYSGDQDNVQPSSDSSGRSETQHRGATSSSSSSRHRRSS